MFSEYGQKYVDPKDYEGQMDLLERSEGYLEGHIYALEDALELRLEWEGQSWLHRFFGTSGIIRRTLNRYRLLLKTTRNMMIALRRTMTECPGTPTAPLRIRPDPLVPSLPEYAW